MSLWLVAAVGVVYLIVALDQLSKANIPMAIMWAGYSFAQVGLWLTMRGQA